MFYTYIYIDPRTNLPFYVGKGSRNRANDHLRRKDHHPMTYCIQKMLSEECNPIIHKIDCSTEQSAFDLEIGLIRLIGRKDLGTGPLLNLTPGGDSPPRKYGKDNYFYGKKGPRCDNRKGTHQTEETRQKISNARKGKKPNHSGMTGRHHTEESKLKASKSLTGLLKNKTWVIDQTSGKRVWKEKITIL